MGLDMYLNAKRSFYGDEDRKLQEDISALLPEVSVLPRNWDGRSPLNELTVRAGYWRKANAIHRWFVTNVQGGTDDCGYYDVDRESLTTLLNVCKQVIADPSQAAELLPTQEGFFFGDTTYGEYYISDLNETVQIIDKALGLPNVWYFQYHSSW